MSSAQDVLPASFILFPHWCPCMCEHASPFNERQERKGSTHQRIAFRVTYLLHMACLQTALMQVRRYGSPGRQHVTLRHQPKDAHVIRHRHDHWSRHRLTDQPPPAATGMVSRPQQQLPNPPCHTVVPISRRYEATAACVQGGTGYTCPIAQSAFTT